MLTGLHVVNYVLIDSLDIQFPEGLVIITGATGAGKSILLGAVSLALGGKADASVIGPSGGNCVVEAEFDVKDDAAALHLLEENDLPAEDGTLRIRRVVAASGRSRSFINDEPVHLALLQDLSARLVDIHSQHQTLRLADKRFRMDMLDHFAGTDALRKECAAAWMRWQGIRKQLGEVREHLDRLEREKDYNQARLQRLEEARLRDGELEELEAEQKQLAHAGEIKETLCAAEEIFSPSDGRSSLSGAIREAEKLIGKAARYIPALAPLSDRMESVRLELEDVEGEVADTNARTEMSPERLEQVEERLSLLYTLMNRHGVQDIASLIDIRDALAEEVSDSSALEEKAARLEIAQKEAALSHSKLCDSLHERREEAAGPFASAILDSLRFLELDHALFQVALGEAPASDDGRDTVEFLFSSTGKNPLDIAKAASGGELSRIMLCLKAMMARYAAMPTLIFDEIDTGVSGSVADRMGSMICAMGDDMQVFAITHLPQVAAKGKAHYLVSKENDTTSITRLDHEGRIRELARMLSGSVVTEAAIANAEALLA